MATTDHTYPFAGIVGTYQRYSYNDEKRAVLEAWARFVAPRDKPAHNVIPLRTYRDFETVLPACYPFRYFASEGGLMSYRAQCDRPVPPRSRLR